MSGQLSSDSEQQEDSPYNPTHGPHPVDLESVTSHDEIRRQLWELGREIADWDLFRTQLATDTVNPPDEASFKAPYLVVRVPMTETGEVQRVVHLLNEHSSSFRYHYIEPSEFDQPWPSLETLTAADIPREAVVRAGAIVPLYYSGYGPKSSSASWVTPVTP